MTIDTKQPNTELTGDWRKGGKIDASAPPATEAKNTLVIRPEIKVNNSEATNQVPAECNCVRSRHLEGAIACPDCAESEKLNPIKTGVAILEQQVMKYNCSAKQEDFLGDNLSWEEIAKALWKILDDIDTLPDMLHPSEYEMADKCWRMMVVRANKRHKYLLSDGYTLTKYLLPIELPIPIDPPRTEGRIKEWA